MSTFDAQGAGQMRIVAGAMIAGAVLVLAMAVVLRSVAGKSGEVSVISYLAIGYALLSPVLATAMRLRALRNPEPETGDARRRAFIVGYGIMEGSLMFCGVALMVERSAWPLAAALVPLGAMVADFPRAQAPRSG